MDNETILKLIRRYIFYREHHLIPAKGIKVSIEDIEGELYPTNKSNFLFFIKGKMIYGATLNDLRRKIMFSDSD